VNPEFLRYVEWLRGHGVPFEIAGALVRDEDHDGPLVEGDEEMRPVEIPGIPPFVEHRDPQGGRAADHATLSLARALIPRIAPGTRFWDIGCGTGVLAVAAGLKGASAIVATDVDEKAIALARRTAADANVAIRFSHGVLLEAVPARLEADLVAANLPHKPCPAGGTLPLSQRAGPDGTDIHAAFAAQAAARLGAGATVGFWLHSLPDPKLLHAYAGAFDLTLVSWKRRFLQPGEYRGLLPFLLDRVDKGTSYMAEESGHRFLVGSVWLARHR